MLVKGQKEKVKIQDINYLGKGVAKIDDFVIFVDDAITGDYVEVQIKEVKKNYALAKLIKIIDNSEHRITPPCEHYYQCGGCQLMNMNYTEQLSYKKNRVISEMKRANLNIDDIEIYDTIGMENPIRYRNKTAFAVSCRNGEAIIGPYEQGTYNAVNISGCLLQCEVADKIVQFFKSMMLRYSIQPYDKKTGKGIVRNIVIRSNRQNQLMLIIVTSVENFQLRDKIVKELTTEFHDLKTIVQNINKRDTNLIMGNKNVNLYGDGTIEDKIDDLIFTISPETFFQINSIQTEKLYRTAIDYAELNDKDVCFDLYCGIGTISLMAAKYAKKVYGVEIVEQSIINAKENAKRNNIDNAEFYAGKTEEVLPRLNKRNISPDVIILDPPRKGCEKEVIDTIIDMSPERIVYVSCNPQTLARDIKMMESGGYKLKKVQPIDQFPWTVHVECVIFMKYCGIEDKNIV